MYRSSAPLLLAALLVLLLPGVAGAAEDPLRDQQWHLDHVGAPRAWESQQGDGVIVAVIDTGVQTDHPDLEGRLVAGRDYVDPGSPPDDENGHGTLVAGIIAANLGNGAGGSGLAPRVQLMPIRVLDAKGEGEAAHVAQGIRWAVRNGAQVVNLSLTEAPGDGGTLDPRRLGLITSEVEAAIREAREEGVLVVGAAGNEGRQTTPYRSGVPIVVVGASDRQDAVWPDSNYDSQTLLAPGVEIISTFAGGGYARADGTSFAAPLASGAAALLMAGGLDADEAEERLRDTARPVGVAAGRIDVGAAVGRPQRDEPPPSTPEQDPPAPTPSPDEAAPQEEPAQEPAPQEPAEQRPAPPPPPAVTPIPEPAGEPEIAVDDEETPAVEVEETDPPLAADEADVEDRIVAVDGTRGPAPEPLDQIAAPASPGGPSSDGWPIGMAAGLLVAVTAAHAVVRQSLGKGGGRPAVRHTS